MKELTIESVGAEVARLDACQTLSLHEEFSRKIARALLSRMRGEARLLAAVRQEGMQGQRCDRCGMTTTHPEGWHYCQKEQKTG